MFRHSVLVVALLFAAAAWSQPSTAPADRVNRPGGTTQIAPTPGPATSPALPSPTLPQAAVDNRDKAQAAKTERKVQKKSKKKKATKSSTAPSGSTKASERPTGVKPAPTR